MCPQCRHALDVVLQMLNSKVKTMEKACDHVIEFFFFGFLKKNESTL